MRFEPAANAKTPETVAELAGDRPMHRRPVRRWELIALTALILAVATADRIWIQTDASPALLNDSYVYLTRLLNFIDTVADRPIGDLDAALAELSHYGRPPLYQLLTIPVVLALGPSEDAATVVNLLFVVLLAVSTWGLGRTVKDGRVGLVAATVALSYPPVVHMARSYLPYAGLAACSAVWLQAVLWLLRSRSIHAAWALGASLCLGVMTHPHFTWMGAPISLLFGGYVWLFQGSPRCPGRSGNVLPWLARRLRDPFLLRGLVPAALLVAVTSSVWYVLAGHRIQSELSRVIDASRGDGAPTFGFPGIETSFWWYAKTAPAVLSTVLVVALIAGLVAVIFRANRPARALAVILVITYIVLSYYPLPVWWFFTLAAPAAAVLSVWWIFELRRKWIVATLAGVVLATAGFNFSLVTWGLPSHLEPVARWLGAPLGRDPCESRTTTALCPFPADPTDPLPLSQVTRSILDDSRCRDNDCQVLALAVDRPDRLEYYAARDSPGSKLKIVNVGSSAWGTDYALHRLLASDYVVFCDSPQSKLVPRSTRNYPRATVDLLRLPPPAFAAAYRTKLSLEAPACGVLRLLARTRPPRIAEAEEWIAALRLAERFKRTALGYLEKKYSGRALPRRFRKPPETWTPEWVDAQVADSEITADDAYLVYRLRAVHLRRQAQADPAVAAYRKAIEHAPNPGTRARARRVLAGYYQDLHRLADAERIYRRLIEEQPHKREAWIRLAELHLDRGDFDAAITLLQTALAEAQGKRPLRRLLEQARHLEELSRH
ncbi:MAG: tetratricopeptide repeat protein [Acidobacteriota bacterium]